MTTPIDLQNLPEAGPELLGFAADGIRPYVRKYTARVECVGCTRPLPLRLSREGEEAARWICAVCARPIAAVCVPNQLPRRAGRIKLDDRYFNTANSPSQISTMREIVAAMAEADRANPAKDRRRSERVSQSLIIPAVMLRSNMNPIGDPFNVMVANISQEGIGMVHADLIEADYLAMRLYTEEQRSIQVVAQLVRERHLDEQIYEIGGEFYARLGSRIDP